MQALNFASSNQLEQLAERELRKWGNPQLIRRQLYLVPEKFNLDQRRNLDDAIAAIPIDEAIKLLPIVDKISVLMRSAGIFKTCHILPLGIPTDETARDKALEDVADFTTQVSLLVDGVAQCSLLSPYIVLRMQLLAIIERWLQASPALEKDIKRLHTNLAELFHVFEIQIQEGAIQPDLQNLIRNARNNCETLHSMWLRKDQGRRADEAQKMIKILDIFERARAHYLLLMPCLLREIEKHSREGNSLETWLVDFKTAFQGQCAYTISFLKARWEACKEMNKHKTEFQQIRKSLEDFNQMAANVIQATIKAGMQLKEFETLKPAEQHARMAQVANIRTLHKEALRQFNAVRDQEARLTPTIVNFLHTISPDQDEFLRMADTQDTIFTKPWNTLQNALTTLINAISHSCNDLLDQHSCFDRLLHSNNRYSSLENVPPIEVLENLINQAFFSGVAFDERFTKMHLEVLHMMEQLRSYYRQNKQSAAVENLDQHLASYSDNADILFQEIKKRILALKGALDPVSVSMLVLLSVYAQIVPSLKRAMNSRSCLELFFRNRLASNQNEAELREAFFCDTANMLRRLFLQNDFPQLIVGLVTHAAESESTIGEQAAKQIRAFAAQLSHRIASEQAKLTKRATLCSDNFMEETKSLFGMLTGCFSHIEKGVERIEFVLQKAQNTPDIQKATELLGNLKSNFHLYFISLGRSLRQYCQEREWLEVEEIKRPQRIRLRKAQTPKIALKKAELKQQAPQVIATKSTPAKPKISEGNLQAFETLCLQLAPLCQSFVLASAAKENVMRTRLQHESATNLLESLPAIRELAAGFKEHGDKPFFAHQLHLKLAVLLEQAGILSSSILNLYRSPDDPGHALFMERGGECFWEKHSPYLLAKTLVEHFVREKKGLILSKNHLALLQGFERTIAVTSRRPSSGADALSDMLDVLTDAEADPAKRQECQQNIEKTFTQSIETGVSLLKLVHVPSETAEIILSPEAIKSCCTPVANSMEFPPAEWRERVEESLGYLEDRLQRLQSHLAIPEQREVPAISRFDQSMRKRIGTIRGALHDLQANLQLCRSLLLSPEEPGYCLVMAESGLLQQAAILEQALLIPLSHLPCRSSPHSAQHYLWKEEHGRRPLRYRHAVEEFAKDLPAFVTEAGIERADELFRETQACAQRLGGHLRQTYRYYGQNANEAAALRDKIKALSILRDKILHDRLTGAEARTLDECLEIADPSLRLARLDQHIAQVLKEQIQVPTLHMLELADEWLEVYEKLLHNEA